MKKQFLWLWLCAQSINAQLVVDKNGKVGIGPVQRLISKSALYVSGENSAYMATFQPERGGGIHIKVKNGVGISRAGLRVSNTVSNQMYMNVKV